MTTLHLASSYFWFIFIQDQKDDIEDMLIKFSYTNPERILGTVNERMWMGVNVEPKYTVMSVGQMYSLALLSKETKALKLLDEKIMA